MKKHELKFSPILSAKVRSDYLPEYVFATERIAVKRIYYLYYNFLLSMFRIILKCRLKIFGSLYKEYEKEPLQKDVENIYNREADTYERKHHLTTNFRDTWWRRQVGLEVINYIYANNRNKEKIKLLDIGTGIGLSLEEMFRIFNLFNVKVNAIGLDYNQKMLEQARSITLKKIIESGLLEHEIREIEWVRGDARNLVKNESQNGLEQFSRNSFDCITIMFGIGGIDFQLESIKEQLAVLKPGGILIITDIHQPISKIEEKWPWFIGRKNGKAFLIMSWEKITKPLVLATLWGWRDPSPIFYTSLLAVIYDEERNIYYGFERTSFFLNNEFWWFGLPVMPTAKIVLKKVEIYREEFEKRKKILSNISF